MQISLITSHGCGTISDGSSNFIIFWMVLHKIPLFLALSYNTKIDNDSKCIKGKKNKHKVDRNATPHCNILSIMLSDSDSSTTNETDDKIFNPKLVYPIQA